MHCGIALRCQLSGHAVIVHDSKIVSFALNVSVALPLRGLAGGTLRGGICLGLVSCLGSKIRMRGSPGKPVRLSPTGRLRSLARVCVA